MRILCFGDSNTYGFDPRGYLADRYAAEDRWVDLLAMQTGWTVRNLGLNGRSIPQTPYAAESLAQAPEETLLVMLGTNDLLQGASAKEAAARMETFLQGHLPCPSRIVLIAPPPMQRGTWVPSDRLVAESLLLAEEYKSLALRLGIPFIDTRAWSIGLAFDGVHFTEAGHHKFAEALRRELEQYALHQA